ncbi:MAG: PepSY domain-containing protein [Pseudomonadota bacterium]
MKMLVPVALSALLVLGSAPAPAAPDQKRDQQEAFDQLRKGRILPLRDIESRVLPRMTGSQYLGVELDSATSIYTLKFVRKGTVIWVYVDARSGKVIGQDGN